MAKTAPDVCTSTPEWRKRARERFKELGRGAKARCARELGVDDSQVNHVLSGRVKTSSWVAAVADWLGIERPQEHVPSARHGDLLRASRELDSESLEIVIALARRLATTRRPDPVDPDDE